RDPEDRLRLGRQLDLLGAARGDDAALTQHATVVVVPARAPGVEEAEAFRIALLGVRIRIDEDVTMVEGSDQLDRATAEHPVPEDVAAHVADPDDGERLRLDVLAQLAEVALDRLPRAARRD